MSLLVSYEECLHCYDWEVGRHGIIIKFAVKEESSISQSSAASSIFGRRASGGGGDKARDFSATYLPDVAAEQGWSREEAVASLIRKAGFNGRIDEPLLGSIQTTRYQSSKTKMTWDEFSLGRNAGV